MAENTKRHLFGLHGITGIIISVFGLIFIWAVLMSQALIGQRNSQARPYDPAPIRDIHNLVMKSVDNKNFAFVDKKEK